MPLKNTSYIFYFSPIFLFCAGHFSELLQISPSHQKWTSSNYWAIIINKQSYCQFWGL